jgi:hypothetical protein
VLLQVADVESLNYKLECQRATVAISCQYWSLTKAFVKYTLFIFHFSLLCPTLCLFLHFLLIPSYFIFLCVSLTFLFSVLVFLPSLFIFLFISLCLLLFSFLVSLRVSFSVFDFISVRWCLFYFAVIFSFLSVTIFFCLSIFSHTSSMLIPFLHLWFFLSDLKFPYILLMCLFHFLYLSFRLCTPLFPLFFLLFLTRTNTRHDTICRDQRGERIQYYLISKPIWQTACNCLPTVLLTTEDVNARTYTSYIPANCALNCPREIISLVYVNDDFMRLLTQHLAIPITWSGTKKHVLTAQAVPYFGILH